MSATGKRVLVLMVLAWTTWATADEPTKPLVFQIETFKLVKAKVEPLKVKDQEKPAKVVVFQGKDSRAVKRVALPKGWHEAVLYVWAADEEKGSTFVKIEADDYDAGVAELPVRPWSSGEIAPCFPIKFHIGDDKSLHEIVIRPDDPGVKIDRLEIR